MASTPPSTGIPGLDEFLRYVSQALTVLDDKAKPEDGWRLTDLEATVSEVIGDKRDLIDIISQWDDSTHSLEGWKDLTAQQSAALESLKAKTEKIISSSETFEEVMMWWDANYRTIFDVKEHTEVIHGDMESIHASEQNVTQMKADVTTLRGEVADDLQSTKDARDAAVAAKGEAEAAKAAAEESEGNARASEEAAEESATLADGRATDAESSRSAALTSRNEAVSAKNDAVVAKDGAVSAQGKASDRASFASTEADRARAEADRARQAAELADGTATEAVTQRVDELLSGAPEAYDTLKEIADKLAAQDDVDAALVQQIAGKLSKVSDASKIYGTDGSGNQATYPFAPDGATANSVAGRSTSGNIYVAQTPTASGHAASKKYVDDLVASAAAPDHTHEIGEVDGLQNELDTLQGEIDGKSNVGHTHTSVEITDAVTTTGRETSAGKLVKTYTDGYVHVNGAPTATTHATPKSYVDGRTPPVVVVATLPPAAEQVAGTLYIQTGV